MLQLLLHPLLTFIESLIRENDISVMVEKRNFAVPLYCPEPCFIIVSTLVSQKVETTRGVPLEFSTFCNPLSLTPVASRTFLTKSWYCRELYKNAF